METFKYYFTIRSWFQPWHMYLLHEDDIFLPKHVSVVFYYLHMFNIVHLVRTINEHLA